MLDVTEDAALSKVLAGLESGFGNDSTRLLGLDTQADPFGFKSVGVRRPRKNPQHAVIGNLRERLKKSVKGTLQSRIQPINAEVIREYLPEPGESTFFLMNGNCEFADFLGVFHRVLQEAGDEVDQMLCSTLSLNAHSFDVLDRFPCTKHVLVSSYFLATDKANVLFAMREKGRLDTYRIGFFRNHTKITLIHTVRGEHYVFAGSANLRSSKTIEQFTIEHSRETYNFVWQWLHPLIEKYNFEQEAELKSTAATFGVV